MTRPDIEDYQSARRRRGETIRALNKSRAQGQGRLRFGAGDTKGAPLSPLKRGDRGGMFTPGADIRGGIGKNIGDRDVLDIATSSPPPLPSAMEYNPQQPSRGGRSQARRKAIRDQIGKNSR